jgi:hypothetical protein
VIFDRRPELVCVKPDAGSDAHEVIDVLEPARALPVRFEESVVHLIELTALARKLRGAKRTSRVDDHLARFHRQTDRLRHRLQVRMDALGSRPTEVGLVGNALGGRLRMQLERQPGDVDESLALELLDSDRVDVAPGSNVVREDDEID